MRTRTIAALALVWVAVAAAPPAAAEATSDTTATVPPDTVRVGDMRIEGQVETPEVGVSPEEQRRLKRTLQLMGRKEVEGAHLWERRKSPKLAMLCNALLPGLGQVYNGRRLKTGIMVGVASFYMGNIWLDWKSAQRSKVLRDKLTPGTSRYNRQNELVNFYKESSKDFLWWSAAVWVIGILDSWIDAHLYDVRMYTPPAQESAAAESNQRYVTLSVSF